ncbi:MAG: N-acetylmuramoyl-L-alanine amidase [Hyphomicrobiaceae bacterium]
MTPDSPLANGTHPSYNVERRLGCARPTILLLHYTGMANAADAIAWLAFPGSKVSCHYVIDDDGRIVQMVAEDFRAWHAGASFWAGEQDINSVSIGIEIQNPGRDGGYPDFPAAQMQAVIGLCQDIVRRHSIRPERVLAHSDVAPCRKKDPGEKFDWAVLARAGVGRWVAPAPADPQDRGLGLDSRDLIVERAQRQLAAYGYGVPTHGEMDIPTLAAVAAFQRHFRPARVDGHLDASTADTLERLLLGLR